MPLFTSAHLFDFLACVIPKSLSWVIAFSNSLTVLGRYLEQCGIIGYREQFLWKLSIMWPFQINFHGEL